MSTFQGKKQDKYSRFISDLAAVQKKTAQDGGGLIFLYGSDEYLVFRSARQLSQSLRKSLKIDDHSYCDIQKWEREDWLSTFTQSSMFGDQSSFLIPRTEKKQKIEKQLAAIPDSYSSDNLYIMTFVKDRLTKALEKELGRLNASKVHCQAPASYQMPQYIMRCAKGLKLPLSLDACRFLAEAVGHDLSLCDNELKRLKLIFHDHQGELQTKDIAAHSQFLREDESFKITDFLINNKPARAEALVMSLLNGGTQPISILGIIARHIRISLLLQTNSAEPHMIGRMPPRVLDRYKQYARKVDRKKLILALEECQTADMICKSQSQQAQLRLSQVFQTLS